MKEALSAILTVLIILGPLTSVFSQGDKEKEKAPAYETRVYTRRQCLLSEPALIPPKPEKEIFGAIAGIILPFILGKALGGVASALKKAGSPETLKDSGRLMTYQYKLVKGTDGKKKLELNNDLGCVILIRGSFYAPDPDDVSKVDIPKNKEGIFTNTGEDGDQRRVERLKLSGIPVQKIAIAYEAKIVLSDDRTGFLYESRFLQVSAFQGDRDQDKLRALVIGLAIHGAGKKEGDPTLSLSLLNLGEVRRDTISGPEQMRKKRSSWFGGVGINDAVLKSIEGLKFDDGSSTKGVMPITIEGTVNESEDGNKALLFIAEVLEGTKSDLAKTISDEILEDQGEAAAKAAAEIDAVEKLRLNEEAAYATCLDAVAKYGADKGSALKKFEAERAIRAWTNKVRALESIGQGAPGQRGFCKIE